MKGASALPSRCALGGALVPFTSRSSNREEGHSNRHGGNRTLAVRLRI